MIQGENVDLVLHQGDFSYSSGPTQSWTDAINNTLGATFPYLGSDGNHDDWNQYVSFFENRLTAMGLDPNAVSLASANYTATYGGLKMVFVQESGNPGFVNQHLAADDHIWRVCSWHANQKAMQVGGKSDQQGWEGYEECLAGGAIVATGHEHSYERTRTLLSAQNQLVDNSCLDNPVTPDPDVCVGPGRNFVFVSGLGGRGMRNQVRCLPTVFPYGCNGEWAKIYTTDQTGGVKQFGALFITFLVDGDPHKARGYFKTTNGELIDEFEIGSNNGGASATTGPISVTNAGGTTLSADPFIVTAAPDLMPPTVIATSRQSISLQSVVKVADTSVW